MIFQIIQKPWNIKDKTRIIRGIACYRKEWTSLSLRYVMLQKLIEATSKLAAWDQISNNLSHTGGKRVNMTGIYIYLYTYTKNDTNYYMLYILHFCTWWFLRNNSQTGGCSKSPPSPAEIYRLGKTYPKKLSVETSTNNRRSTFTRSCPLHAEEGLNRLYFCLVRVLVVDFSPPHNFATWFRLES